MSKFCENCGAELDDNATVCPNCGPQADTQTAEEPIMENTTSSTSSAKSGNTKNIAIIGGVVAVVVILIAIICSIFGKGWKKPIDNYFKGMEKGNAKTYMNAFPEFLDYDYDDDDMEDMKDALEDEYGEKIKISYKVTKKEKIKKAELEDVRKYVEEKYDEKVKVSAGYEVKVKATIKGKDDEDTDTNKMYVYKIDGKWKYFNTSPNTAKDYLKDLKEKDKNK